MPHLRIEYCGVLDGHSDMQSLCARLASALVRLEESGQPVFPRHGTRVLAYPAAGHAVGDGDERAIFVYLNLRIAPGRPAGVVQRTGDALLDEVRRHFAGGPPLRATLHIDEGRPLYEGKFA